MKNKIIITAFAVLTMTGVYTLSKNMEMDVNDAIATDTTGGDIMVVQGECTGQAVQTRAPTALQWILGAATTNLGGPPTFAAENVTTLTGGVGAGATAAETDTYADPNAFSGADAAVTGETSGFNVVNLQTPTIKLGGLTCSAVTSSGLKAFGNTTVNNANLNITMQALAVGTDKTYDSALLLDALLVGSARTIFGSGAGDAGTALIIDGSDNMTAGSVPDAEIVFGGVGAASTGSSMLQMEFDVTGIAATTLTTEDVQFQYNY